MEIFMETDTATLKDLVEVLNDGKNFYEAAASGVELPQFKQIFSQMARTKAAMADDFKTMIVVSGESAPEGGSIGGSLRKAWAEVAAKLSNTPNAEYVGQLEDFEDRIVREFRSAVNSTDDAKVRALAEKHLPDVLRDHDQMRALKHAMNP
jgi:uncharacterized protein (TIGR02284 family)